MLAVLACVFALPLLWRGPCGAGLAASSAAALRTPYPCLPGLAHLSAPVSCAPLPGSPAARCTSASPSLPHPAPPPPLLPQDATHFRRTTDPQTGKEVLEPCSPGDPGAFEATLQVRARATRLPGLPRCWTAAAALAPALVMHGCPWARGTGPPVSICTAAPARAQAIPACAPSAPRRRRRWLTRGWRGWCTPPRSRTATLKRWVGGRDL